MAVLKASNIKLKCSQIALGLALSIICVQPAQAQFPYWYLYAGQSLLYPLTRGIGLPYYGSYNSNPLYSTSSFLRRTAGRAAQFPYIYPYNANSFGPYGYRNAGLPANYSSQQQGDGMVDPNTGRPITGDDDQQQGSQSAPNFYLPGPQNQSLYTQPAGQGQYSQSDQSPIESTPVQFGAMPPQSAQSVPLVEPNAKSSNMPPKAPKHKKSRTKSESASPAVSQTDAGRVGSAPDSLPNSSSNPLANTMSNSSTTATNTLARVAIPSPLADGFVDHLVTKYDGHMGNALNNSDTRNWAKAMGLIDSDPRSYDSLSPDRIEVMGKILKDNSLDSVSKVDAVRILLKQKPVVK